MERKEAVLGHLKRAGSASLDEIASALGLTKQGSLRHLEALRQSGLVEMKSEEHHEGRGRPRHVYRLSAAAATRFPQDHQRLAGELVRFLPPAELDRFFRERALRLEAEYAPRLAGRDLRGRVEELARLASERGHMASAEELADGGFAIRQCNCPIVDVAGETGHPCRHEQELYARLLGAEVVRTSFLPEAAASCTYVVKPAGTGTELGNKKMRARRQAASIKG